MSYNSGECELCGQYRSIRSSNGLCATCKAGSRNSSITDTVREIRNKEHREVAEAAQRACAASPWNYDVDAAPRDVDLLTVSAEGNLVVAQRWTPDENGNEWYGDACRFTPSAWAAINLPEIGQT